MDKNGMNLRNANKISGKKKTEKSEEMAKTITEVKGRDGWKKYIAER